MVQVSSDGPGGQPVRSWTLEPPTGSKSPVRYEGATITNSDSYSDPGEYQQWPFVVYVVPFSIFEDAMVSLCTFAGPTHNRYEIRIKRSYSQGEFSRPWVVLSRPLPAFPLQCSSRATALLPKHSREASDSAEFMRFLTSPCNLHAWLAVIYTYVMFVHMSIYIYIYASDVFCGPSEYWHHGG